ncbi:MAG: DNA-processing protein DprA [Oscillospiraceae bacterium]|nr:DNA-processing protein DprA [Oscillospiraceae bacterium]
MTAAETGVLMLTCPLGQMQAPILTAYQFAQTAKRVRLMRSRARDPIGELTDAALYTLGFTLEQSARLVKLLSREELCSAYLLEGERQNVTTLTVRSEQYPAALRRLGAHTPPALFAKGDLSILQLPRIALVGSRALLPKNRIFAERIGIRAAERGYALVSGGAAGADRTAQEACLSHGGSVIVCTPEQLSSCPEHTNVLYLSELGYDLPFSIPRALSRNRVIHALGEKTFVAQCTAGRGGTWQGSTENLREGYSPLYVFDDGSDGANALIARGAEPIRMNKQEV